MMWIDLNHNRIEGAAICLWLSWLYNFDLTGRLERDQKISKDYRLQDQI